MFVSTVCFDLAGAGSLSLVRLFSLLFSVESPIDANSFVEPAHCFACVQCEKRNYWPGIKLWTWQILDILNCGLGFVKVCSPLLFLQLLTWRLFETGQTAFLSTLFEPAVRSLTFQERVPCDNRGLLIGFLCLLASQAWSGV